MWALACQWYTPSVKPETVTEPGTGLFEYSTSVPEWVIESVKDDALGWTSTYGVNESGLFVEDISNLRTTDVSFVQPPEEINDAPSDLYCDSEVVAAGAWNSYGPISGFPTNSLPKISAVLVSTVVPALIIGELAVRRKLSLPLKSLVKIPPPESVQCPEVLIVLIIFSKELTSIYLPLYFATSSIIQAHCWWVISVVEWESNP